VKFKRFKFQEINFSRNVVRRQAVAKVGAEVVMGWGLLVRTASTLRAMLVTVSLNFSSAVSSGMFSLTTLSIRGPPSAYMKERQLIVKRELYWAHGAVLYPLTVWSTKHHAADANPYNLVVKFMVTWQQFFSA
jgi:hypothetical protein